MVRYIKYIFITIVIYIIIYTLIILFLHHYTGYNDLTQVPNFIGKDVNNIENLSNKKLKTKIGYTYDSNFEKNTIINQYPLPYSMVKNNRIIYINVACSTIKKIKKSDIINMSKRDVINILNQNNIYIEKIYYTQSEIKDKLIYIKCKDELINYEIYNGCKVQLFFGNGINKNEIKIPFLQGLTLDEAIKIIIEKKLTVGLIYYDRHIKDKNKSIIYKYKPSIPSLDNEVLYGTPINIYLCDEKS
ncbi:MAG: PASTA domain-containing protein [Bacteroides sp.]|nr:MAG: PASTA domain-containing protein [Bacteroides sp.]